MSSFYPSLDVKSERSSFWTLAGVLSSKWLQHRWSSPLHQLPSITRIFLCLPQGEALDAEGNETKLHQSRLASLEAELERLRIAHENASRGHKEALSQLDPLHSRKATLEV